MKTRIAKTVAAAGVLALSLTGCSLLAPVATEMHYDASDGVSANVGDVAVRNLILVANEEGKNLNVVFTGVNETETAQEVTFNFEGTAGADSAAFQVEPGSTLFGNPAEADNVRVVDLGEQAVGSTVEASITVGDKVTTLSVPVLGGELDTEEGYQLKEYAPYMLTDEQVAKLTKSE